MSQKETFLLPDGRRTSDLKVTELRIELDKRGKSKSGKKSELLNRLNESFSSSNNCISVNEKSNSVSSEIPNEGPENDQASYDKSDIESEDVLPTDSRVVNIKKVSKIDVDMDATDDNQQDNVEINQSVDTLDLFVPMDDSLNIADESHQDETIQITISRTDNEDVNCDDDQNVERVIETIRQDERRVICGVNDLKKEEPKDDSMGNSNATELNESKQDEIEKEINIESEVMENEVDDIENIELETQIEMYDVDNIDLDGHMEMYDDHNKDEKADKNETKDDNIVVTVKHDATDGHGNADDTEEGEVITVPITARLGKRKVKDESKKHSSPKKTKNKGLKETKGSGYIVEGPERIQPAQKARNIVSDVLRVDNLVRPFTLVQLQEMLSIQGPVKDVWLNKIKSVAYVRYETESVAISARENIDGCKWPSINPKLLACDFVLLKEMEWMKEKGDTGINPPSSFKPQLEQPKPAASDNDWKPGTDKQKLVNREPYKPERSNDSKKRPQNDRDVIESKRRRTPNADQHHRRRNESPKDRPRDHERERERERVREKSKDKPQPAVKLLEDIFRKTVAQPAIYWLPVAKDKKDESIKKTKEPVRAV